MFIVVYMKITVVRLKWHGFTSSVLGLYMSIPNSIIFDPVEKGEVSIHAIKTTHQIADYLTKPLNAATQIA